MRPRVAALCAVYGVLAGRSGAAAPVRADGVGHIGSGLRLDCQDLDAEGQASFEARARAELVSAPVPAGEVAVACADSTAVVTWWAADGGFRESSLPLPADRATAVDALLGAIQALRAADGVTRAPARPSASPIAGALEPAEVPALRAVPVPRAWNRLGAVAGAEAERWQGAIGGAVGARFGARLLTPGRWSFALTAGASWGTGAAQGIRALSLVAASTVAYQPFAHLELALGAEMRLLTATASGGAAGSTERHDWTEGATASARYVIKLGPARLAIGPRAGLLAHPFVIEVAGKELFRVPAVVAGLSVDGATDFVR